MCIHQKKNRNTILVIIKNYKFNHIPRQSELTSKIWELCLRINNTTSFCNWVHYIWILNMNNKISSLIPSVPSHFRVFEERCGSKEIFKKLKCLTMCFFGYFFNRSARTLRGSFFVKENVDFLSLIRSLQKSLGVVLNNPGGQMRTLSWENQGDIIRVERSRYFRIGYDVVEAVKKYQEQTWAFRDFCKRLRRRILWYNF